MKNMILAAFTILSLGVGAADAQTLTRDAAPRQQAGAQQNADQNAANQQTVDRHNWLGGGA